MTEHLYQEEHGSKLDFVAHSSGSQHEVENSWYYYLADIAARRILERVVDTFYVKEAISIFHTNLLELIETAKELQRQLTQWYVDFVHIGTQADFMSRYQTLPVQMSFAHGTFAEDELAFHLQARGIEIKERIHRPFLLLMVHRDLSPTEVNALAPFVQEHINACLELIKHWNCKHRHHGTWLMVRQSFASALLLVAAHKSGVEVATLDICRYATQVTLATLQYWEQEAPDLRASRFILEGIRRDAQLD